MKKLKLILFTMVGLTILLVILMLIYSKGTRTNSHSTGGGSTSTENKGFGKTFVGLVKSLNPFKIG